MTVAWAIQTNLINETQSASVAFAAGVAGAEVYGVKCIPFQDEIEMDFVPETSKVIPYGSTKLSKLAEKHNWSGLFFDNEMFKVSTWIKERDDMLNHDSDILTLKEAAIKYSTKNQQDFFFIRPNEDLKAFSGAVTTAQEITRWSESIDSGNFHFMDDILVAIAPPKNILAEWRWFVVDGKVIDGSAYRMKGQLKSSHEDDAAVISEAQTLADQWLPNQTVCMDLALTEEGMKVIEFNAMNSSGFYAHDIQKVVSAITESMRSK